MELVMIQQSKKNVIQCIVFAVEL